MYVSVNNCIYFEYSLCTLKPGEKTECMQSGVNAIKRTGDYKCHIWPDI
jgi:hypothetical protein